MSRVKIKPWLFRVQIVIILLCWISISYSFQYPYNIKKCGDLFSQDGFLGLKRELMDQLPYHNLPDIYQDSNGWDTISSIKVESGCSMSLCNDTYLDGKCESLPAGSYGSSQLSLNIGFPIASVYCSCQRECNCSDVFVNMPSCARAYLQGGCKTCNASYIDLRNATVEIAQEFVGKVEAFRLRKGCKLKLYSETDFDGTVETITSEIFEDFNGEFRSFQCECNSSEFVPRVRPPRPSTLPPLVDIPNSVKEIKAMLHDPKYLDHIGLKAAIKSRRNKRSSKNAYILLLGTIGSGKTCTMNLLFDNPYITKSRDNVSTTTNILEFRMPIPLDELGLKNTELRVIDTPGLGDTRGSQQDAKFLATLDNFLSTHEELNDLKPNAILVFHNFNDNRFAGESNSFIKMLRGIDSFRERLTDENFSNVIHVLTHYSSVSGRTRRRPTERINAFRKVIQEYTTFPRPTIITVAENKGTEESLPMINGYFRLANNEYYPRNLFDQLEFITKNGADPIGQGVFRSAFRDSQEINVTKTTYKLTSNEGDMVQRYLRIVSNTYLDINKTEVSELLQQVWDNELSEELKAESTNALQYLQNALHMRHINSKDDVPKTTTEVLKLLTVLRGDLATRTLLEKAIGIKPPNFPQNPIAGYCYNIFTDAPLPETPFQMEELHESDIGFMLPNFLTCKLEQSSTENFIFVEDQPSYVRERLRRIGIEDQVSPTLFNGATKPGYNIKTTAFQNGGSLLSAQRTFKRFQFVVNERSMLKQGFVESVKALPNFNEHDNETVTKWIDFFETYGTHVVKSIDGGGAIEIQLRNNGSIDKEMSRALFSLISFTEDIAFFMGDNETSEEANRTLFKSEIDHTLLFSGGSPKYHTKDFIKLRLEDAADMMSRWQKSLKYSPTLLTSEIELIPISRVARKIGSNYEQEIQRVANIIYNSTLKYVPKSNPVGTRTTPDRTTPIHVTVGQTPVQAISEREPALPPPPREETMFMTEFFMEMQKSNQRLQEVMTNLRMMEMEHALQRDKLEREKLQWEKEKVRILSDVEHVTLSNIEDERREAAAWRIRLAQLMMKRVDAEKQRQWMGVLNEQQAAESAKSQDLMRAILSRPQSRGGSCLKAGTMIQMADGMQKPVELLKAGDIVVDKDLMPTSVLGVAHEFLLDQIFYGFDNSSFFFTNNHLFIGPKVVNSESENFTIFVKSTEYLYNNNPLLRYINVRSMPENGSFTLFHMENLSNKKFISKKTVTVTEDPNVYPLDTPMYFIQVNSSSGTYIANGYVCRHETPPFELWPNTMSILFRLVKTNAFDKISLFPYNIETEIYLQNSIKGTTKKVNKFFENREWSNSGNESNYEIMTLKDVDVDECIVKIYNNPTLSNAGIRFYATVGQVIAMYLDEETEQKIDSAIVGKIQHELYQILFQEIENYSVRE
ncbi:unnamed protein product [Orchesella dallaii]|uniref:MACPF domain-containing protein n=2 Tax=Orchesella dallaii TaxID=48710 RepID=A0ABP1R8M5_9HEXA